MSMMRFVSCTIFTVSMAPLRMPSVIRLVMVFSTGGPNSVRTTLMTAQLMPRMIMGISFRLYFRTMIHAFRKSFGFSAARMRPRGPPPVVFISTCPRL